MTSVGVSAPDKELSDLLDFSAVLSLYFVKNISDIQSSDH